MKTLAHLRRCRVLYAALFAFCLQFLATKASAANPPLSITCPTNLTLWTCSSNIVWQYPPPSVTGGCSNYVVRCDPPSGSVFQIGVTEVTCRVIDGCQNSDSCTFTVTVRKDTVPPVIQCPTNLHIKACPTATGGCGAFVTYPPVLATDNSGDVAVTCNPPSGSFFACGVHVVTCRAEDRCGNKDECSFTVTVESGGQAPGIQCPADQTILTCSNSAVLTYPAPVVNPPGTTVVCNPPVGTVLPLGSHAVTCIASNACGIARCTFKVEVRPVPPPTIRCPTNLVVTVPCQSNCVPVFYAAPFVANGSLMKCDPPSGTCLPIGVHTVTCVATNVCGDRDVCSFDVRVIQGQSQPPVIRCPTNLVFTVPCGSNCVPVNYPAPTVINGSLMKCDPPSGTCLPVGVHTVTCIATNVCGDRDVCSFDVRVIQGQGQPPVIRCPTNLVFTVPCGSNCVPVNYPAPTVVNGSLMKCDPPSGTCLPVGVHTVTCVATNVCGERDVCSFDVRVIQGQGQPPIIRCPPDITVVACSNDCAVVTYPAPVVVNGTLVKCDPPSGSCLPVGTHIVRCEARNDCGTNECKFTVTVLPDQRPRLHIKREGRFVVICWPKTCACYKLQSTRSLNPPIVWTDVPVTPDDHGDSWCVRIPIEQRHRFFRLIKCDQTTASIYRVLENGITGDHAARLADALNLPRQQMHFEDGLLLFLDPAKFQAVPVRPIQDPGIIDLLRRNAQDDDGDEMAFEAFDFDAINRIVPMDGERASDLFKRAILFAGIGPKPEDPASIGPKPEDPIVRHTVFEASDANGRPLADGVKLDTHVIFPLDLDGVPLIGPGANLRMAFSPGGDPTALHVAYRKLEKSGEVPIISPDEAARRCAELYPQLPGSIRPRLIYYSPSLLLPAVQRILPCYECGGSATSGGQQVSLLETVIPAVDDPDLVPAVILEASANGNLVNARAIVRGGTPPYSFQWLSSSADLSGLPPDAASIEYHAQPREDETTETVRVLVTDANGIPVGASKTVEISGGPVVLFSMAVGGVVDYGTERAVSDMGFGIHSGFNSRMSAGGSLRRFNFSGASCWERDFKQGGTGLDHQYTDNVDMTFYIGHGYGGGFTFESNKDDDTLFYSDAVGDWGNGDMEWLSLVSCQVLKSTWDGKSWASRWIPNFDGLHMMLGFETNAHDWDLFGYSYADWLHGRFGIFPALPVRSAWFMAKAEAQPAADIAVAIGVIGPGGCHNANDYYHGRGPVGPDIRKTQVQGWWRFDFQ